MVSVQIRKIESYALPALSDAVADFLRNVSSSRLKRSKRVLLKPNLLGAFPPERAVTTHPAVLEALVRYWLDLGKEVWIGDSPGGTVNVDTVWQSCGMKDLAERYPVKLVNLSTSGFRELEQDGIRLQISEVLWQCGIVINVAKYKTHGMMAFTGALKNLYGLIPGLVKTQYHGLYPNNQDFAAMLLALYQLTRGKISYSFIDGITGMDGNGPSAGRVRNFGLLLGSTSISALDYIAATRMGFELRDVSYLSGALHVDGLLPSRISVPTSFRHYVLPDADIRAVKLRSDLLRYVPRAARHAFKRVYYHNVKISDRCRKCGVCVSSCPVQAISAATPTRLPRIDQDKCIKCMCCHELCPYQAVDIHKSPVARMVSR